MSLHSRILPVLIAGVEAAIGCRTYGRRRMVASASKLIELCGTTDTVETDGGSAEIELIKACFITRTADSVPEDGKKEEPDGNEYAVIRGPEYEFEIWLSYSDDLDSETRVQALYDALADYFETAAFRTALAAQRAVLVDPLEMLDSTISVVHTGDTMSRVTARCTIQGEAT